MKMVLNAHEGDCFFRVAFFEPYCDRFGFVVRKAVKIMLLL